MKGGKCVIRLFITYSALVVDSYDSIRSGAGDTHLHLR